MLSRWTPAHGKVMIMIHEGTGARGLSSALVPDLAGDVDLFCQAGLVQLCKTTAAESVSGCAFAARAQLRRCWWPFGQVFL